MSVAKALVFAGSLVVIGSSLFLRGDAFLPLQIIGVALILSGIIGLVDDRQHPDKS